MQSLDEDKTCETKKIALQDYYPSNFYLLASKS